MSAIGHLSCLLLAILAGSTHVYADGAGGLPLVPAATSGPSNGHASPIVEGNRDDQPVLRATPSELNFGDLPAGTTGAEQFVEIENTGTLALEITGVIFRGLTASAYELTLDDCTGTTLQPADNCVLGVTFTPDVAGVFQVELRVSTAPLDLQGIVPITGTSNVVYFDGFEGSALVGRQAPVADAGPDRDVPRGLPAQLDGSNSFDPENQPLSYLWSLEGPAGSNATLDDPNSATPTFTPDVLGSYTATLVVSADGFASSPDEVALDALPVITVGSVAFPTFSSAVLEFSLDQPAGSGGLELQLNNPSPGLFATPDTIEIAQGATGTELDIESGSMAGSTSFSAESPGYWPGTAVVTIQPRQMSLELDPLVGVDRTNPGLLVLELPAPAGGVEVSLSSSDTDAVTVSPSSLNLIEGETEAAFEVTGISGGGATITATAAGYTEAAEIVGATDSTVSVGEIPEMVPGQSASLPVSLSQPAPPGGTTILLESADPAVVTVDESVFIAEGQLQPPANPQVTGQSPGSTEIFARAEGFAPDSRTATVNAFQLSLDPDPLQVFEGWTRSISATLSAAAPPEGLTVNLSGGDPAVFVHPDSFSFSGGQTTTSFEITGVAVGTSSLTATGANLEEAVFDVEVDPQPDITLADTTVGRELQRQHSVRLDATPPGPTTITLTVADESTALLSTSPDAVGAKQITFENVETTSNQFFHIQGLAEGNTTITAQAAGYNDKQAALEVRQSGFSLSTGDFSTTTFSGNTTIDVRLWMLGTTGNLSAQQPLRPGATNIELAVTSSDTNVGTITDSPLVFEPGVSRRTTEFDPDTAGTTEISFAQPAGFTTAGNARTSLTATVTEE